MIKNKSSSARHATAVNNTEIWLSVLSDHKKLIWGDDLGPKYFRSLSMGQKELLYSEVLKGISYVLGFLSDEHVKRALSDRGYHVAKAEPAIFSVGSAKYDPRTWLGILLGYEHATFGGFGDYCSILGHLDRRQNLANLTAYIEQLRREAVIHYK